MLLPLLAYAAVVLALSAAAISGFRMFRPLTPLPPSRGHRVSIVVAAKEEADTLRESLASLVELDHPDKEVIVVCGPSLDGTEEVAREFADRVTVLSEPERPADWLGKSWACHNGYLKSTGDVLLFTDGDVIHTRESLGVALANLEAGSVDLLSAWPEIVTRTRAERTVFPSSIFFLCAGAALTATRRTPKGRRIVGANGQYIMIRREAYAAIGGHQAIKANLMEDGAMGKAVLNRGLDAINVNGKGSLKVKPYRVPAELWEAHERFGAGIIPSWGRLAAALALTLAYYVGPFVLLAAALASGDEASAAVAGAICAMVYATQAFFSLKTSSAQYFLLAPLSGLLVAAAFTVGFVKFRRGGITWKRVKYARDQFRGF